MKPIEYIEEVRLAYEATLESAAERGTEEFCCGALPCSHCPFKLCSGSCNDPTVTNGAGAFRTVEEWQQWWYELTGERDTRTAEEINKDTTGEEDRRTVEEINKDTTEEPTVTETECGEDEPTLPTAELTAEHAVKDAPQPVEPTVSIVWNTAAGKIENHTGTMSLLCSEIDRFRKELSVWLECMNRPVDSTPNSLVDYISFIATAQDGAIVCKCQLFADQFGKRKVWGSIKDTH